MNSSGILIIKKLISDGCFTVSCKGKSMYPTLKDGEVVDVHSFFCDIVCGDIVLYYIYKNDEPIFVIHRVHYISKEYVVLKGDNNVAFDEPIFKNQLLGFIQNDSGGDINYETAKRFFEEFKRKSETYQEKTN